MPGAMSHQARRFPGLPHPQLGSPQPRRLWARRTSPRLTPVTDPAAPRPQAGGGARRPGDAGADDPGATSLVSEVGPPTEALECGRHPFSSTFRRLGRRNPRPALRLCHLLEKRGKCSGFHGVASLNQAERGPRTGAAGGGRGKRNFCHKQNNDSPQERSRRPRSVPIWWGLPRSCREEGQVYGSSARPLSELRAVRNAPK